MALKKRTSAASACETPAADPRPAAACAALLFCVHVWLGLGFIRSAAPTYDEAVHLASGYTDLKLGRYRLNAMDHPALAEMWAAAALVPRAPGLFLQEPDWISGRVYHYSDLFLYRNGGKPLLDRARAFNLLTLSGLLAAALFFWAWAAGGPTAAVAVAAAHAFSPAVLSNFSLVTTDAASTALFFCACAMAAAAQRRDEIGRPSDGFWLTAGAAAGLALASKFNMIALPPILLAAAVLSARAGGRRMPTAGLAWLLLAAAVALAAVYRFGQAGVWVKGLAATLRRLEEGRASFFLGRHSVEGFFAYFPTALAMKTPLPVLALAAVGLISTARAPLSRGVWLWLPPAAYMAAALTAKVQVGYRHVLPVVPFLLLWAGLGAARLSEAGLAGRLAAALLAAWTAACALSAAPHQLAYFNELAGGPARGHERLVDSNLDWGQALQQLGEELERRGRPPIYFAYFGTADPAAHGLRWLPVGLVSNVTRTGNEADPAASGKVLLAISATNLQGTYYRDHEVFAWLKARVPVHTAGHAIFLYDLTADAEARARLAALLPEAQRGSLAPKAPSRERYIRIRP